MDEAVQKTGALMARMRECRRGTSCMPACNRQRRERFFARSEPNSSDAIFNEPALRAIGKWRFEPGTIHGTPVRFRDPARFAFAHGGKDGHPFPVPIKVYDETIGILQTAVQKAKVGQTDKKEAIRQLSELARAAEKDFTPTGGLDKLIEKERVESWMHDGRTVFGRTRPPEGQKKVRQLRLF